MFSNQDASGTSVKGFGHMEYDLAIVFSSTNWEQMLVDHTKRQKTFLLLSCRKFGLIGRCYLLSNDSPRFNSPICYARDTRKLKFLFCGLPSILVFSITLFLGLPSFTLIILLHRLLAPERFTKRRALWTCANHTVLTVS